MKYRMIVSDMDGTLLRTDCTISKRNADAIRRATDSGIKFVLATGRPIQGVRSYAAMLGLSGPVITYNGAVVVDLDTEEILYEESMNRADAELSLRLGQEYDTTMCIWSKGRLYVNKMNDRADDYMKISGVEPILVTDFSEILDSGITKILWYDTPEMIGRMPDEMAKKGFISTTFCLSRPYFLEFFSSNVSKAAAVGKVCEINGISNDEVIALGDAPNDLSMLEFAGLGVAMENALDEVKAAVSTVTKSNDDDGVAEVIERFVLG